MSDPESAAKEIRLLEIQIAALRRERDDLRAQAKRQSVSAKLKAAALRLTLVVLWLVGAASALVVLLYVLLMTGFIRMGPG